MSLKYQRFQPPPEGQTLLLDFNKTWKDPRKPENEPMPKLESEKGSYFPSWGNILTASTAIGLLATFTHYKGRVKI